MAKQKFYVVWEGKVPGIYRSWDDCKEQVAGVKDARYKSFPTLEAATEAFRSGPQARVKAAELSVVPEELFSRPDGPIRNSICVDAACSGNPGKMEYQGVDTSTGAKIFHLGPMERGTNNIGEFLAIVHALAFLRQRGIKMPVYTDSSIALSWISKKKANTKLQPSSKTSRLFELIRRAEKWLENNPGPYNIRKWDTARWGEIPADFGRK